MDKEQAVVIARRYAQEVTKTLQPEQIILFGSYAKDNARDESDIDIAVVYTDFSGDWLKTSSWLCSQTRNVSSYIEPILVDRAYDRSGFVEEICKTGEVIYQRP